jgi:hypothetical protein
MELGAYRAVRVAVAMERTVIAMVWCSPCRRRRLDRLEILKLVRELVYKVRPPRCEKPDHTKHKKSSHRDMQVIGRSASIRALFVSIRFPVVVNVVKTTVSAPIVHVHAL